VLLSASNSYTKAGSWDAYIMLIKTELSADNEQVKQYFCKLRTVRFCAAGHRIFSAYHPCSSPYTSTIHNLLGRLPYYDTTLAVLTSYLFSLAYREIRDVTSDDFGKFEYFNL
jgi:hypothetical protein